MTSWSNVASVTSICIPARQRSRARRYSARMRPCTSVRDVNEQGLSDFLVPAGTEEIMAVFVNGVQKKEGDEYRFSPTGCASTPR